MCLVHEFGRKVSAKSVLGVMRRMRLRYAIRSRNPWKRYNSYRGDEGGHVHNLPERDFDAARPFSKLGTDVTEFKVSGGRGACSPCSRSACPPARSRSCTATWDGSTSTDGGGTSSNASASAGP